MGNKELNVDITTNVVFNNQYKIMVIVLII